MVKKKKPKQKPASEIGEPSDHLPQSEQEQGQRLLQHTTRKRGRPRKVTEQEEKHQDESEEEEEEEKDKDIINRKKNKGSAEAEEKQEEEEPVNSSSFAAPDVREGGIHQQQKPRSKGRRKSKPRKST